MRSWARARTASVTVCPTVVFNSAARRLRSSCVAASMRTVVLCMQISLQSSCRSRWKLPGRSRQGRRDRADRRERPLGFDRTTGTMSPARWPMVAMAKGLAPRHDPWKCRPPSMPGLVVLPHVQHHGHRHHSVGRPGDGAGPVGQHQRTAESVLGCLEHSPMAGDRQRDRRHEPHCHTDPTRPGPPP